MEHHVRKLAVVVVLGAVMVAGCSSSGSKATSTTTTTSNPTGPTTTTVASTPTSAKPPTTKSTTPRGRVGARGLGELRVAESGLRARAERSASTPRPTAGTAGTRSARSAFRGELQETIRFIDAVRRLRVRARLGRLQITHDAGATWTTVSRRRSRTSPTSRSCAARSTWSRCTQANRPVRDLVDTGRASRVETRPAHACPIGAGPVPQEQIVLAGSRGWILDRESHRHRRRPPRRRTERGRTWTPPCSNVRTAPPYLRRRSTTDLVAACNEGVRGGTAEDRRPPSTSRTTAARRSRRTHIPAAKFGVRPALTDAPTRRGRRRPRRPASARPTAARPGTSSDNSAARPAPPTTASRPRRRASSSSATARCS